MDIKRPRSPQTTWSVNFDESSALSPHSRLKYDLAECIETKTVTTTTTTKRAYPPLVFKEATSLYSLDSKEYPLAQKDTPAELKHFRFCNDQRIFWPDDHVSRSQHVRSPLAPESGSTTNLHPADYGTFQSTSSAFDESDAVNFARHTFHTFPQQKSQRSASRSASPVVGGSAKKKFHRSSVRGNAPTLPQSTTDEFRRPSLRNARKDGDRDIPMEDLGLPITPDTTVGFTNGRKSENLRRTNLDSYETPETEAPRHSQSFFPVSSPLGVDSSDIFSRNVATPPITDADADVESFADADESLQQSIRAIRHPRPINTLVAQDVSLPSPRLSPTLQATQLHTPIHEDAEVKLEEESSDTARDDSQNTSEEDVGSSDTQDMALGWRRHHEDASQLIHFTLADSRSMLETFEAMPTEMKSFMMYQFLRRCSRKTLHLVAGVVNPALKCDILKDLPLELTLHVLSYLDYRDLCRAAQVSKHWRSIVDSNETGWKELFDLDGFALAQGELDRAIKEGWGWQDPVGPEGCERDYSLHNRLTSSETELRSTSKPDAPPHKTRSSKRKRALNNFGSERQKRRASAQDNVCRDERTFTSDTVHKSEGPMSAANAAVLAVPDPQLGLASLRKLHLFKSLYRRHHMIRKSWTSGKVKPGHVAFAAHPRHVITCLQFDEDKIITGSDDMLIHVYDTKTGKLRRRLEGHEGGVWALQYEGNTLVSGSTDRSVRVWDIEKGLCTQVFYGHTSTVRCLQILMPTDTGKVENRQAVMMPPKPLIITGSRDSQLRVWRLPEAGSRRYIQTGPPANDADCPYFVRTLQGHSHSVRAIAAHTDTLVSGSYDNTVRVWRISTGETVHVLQGHSQKVYSVVLDVARNRCISGSMDSFVKIWDLDSGSCLHTLEGHSLLVGLLDLRDERLVSAAADSTLRIWDPESGRCQSTLTAHTGAITCFQHDGRKVISGSDRTLKMWDIRTGECIQDLLTDLSGVWQVRFDERRCVAAVQRDNLTYVEILDFGAVRDGKKPEELGKRILLNAPEVQRIIEEDT